MDTKQTLSPDEELAHSKVVHQLKRRIRLISPVLHKDAERAYILEILLKKRDGILHVRTVPEIASVVIHFDPKKLPKTSLLKLLDTLLGNLGQKKPLEVYEAASEPLTAGAGKPLEHNLTIDGMTCVSCALLIEMLLHRDPRIASAEVNYATETASIKGHISQDAVCSMIHRMGYRAQSFDSAFQRRRREIVARYAAGFASVPEVRLHPVRPGMTHAWHLYPIALELERLRIDRARFIEELRALNIGTSVHFIPIHFHPHFRDRLGLGPGAFPVAEDAYARAISLPLFPRITDRDADDVVAAVARVAAGHRA